jgi:arginase family enzyme
MRNVIDELPVARVVQVGVRDQSREEHALTLSDPRIVPWPDHTLRARLDAGETWAALRAEIVLGLPERVYVSFDIDGLDPVYAPGTGTPEIGGLTTLEAQHILRGLQGLDLVGGDVVEVSPPFDPSGNTALVGATLMFEIMCCWPTPSGGAGQPPVGKGVEMTSLFRCHPGGSQIHIRGSSMGFAG